MSTILSPINRAWYLEKVLIVGEAREVFKKFVSDFMQAELKKKKRNDNVKVNYNVIYKHQRFPHALQSKCVRARL